MPSIGRLPAVAPSSPRRREHRQRARVDRVAAQLRRAETARDRRGGRAARRAPAPARQWLPPAPRRRSEHVRHSACARARWRCSSSRTRGSCRAPPRRCAARPTFGMKSRSHVRVRRGLVDRRRQEPVVQRERRGDDAGGAAGALRMPDHRLGRRARHAIGAAAEQPAHAARLDGVVEHGRGAVKVDVADLLERAAGSIDREPHRADDLLAVGIHLHAVVGVAGRAVAVDGGVDRARRARGRAPRARAPASRRPRRARTRRGPHRTGARRRRACRCSGSRRRASSKSRRSSRA